MDWNHRFDEVKAFVAEHGHLPQYSDDTQLYNWLAGQRTRTTLTAEQKRLMRSLPGWHWDMSPDAKWTRNFTVCARWYKHNDGHPHVKDTAAGRWATTQRTKYRSGALSDDRIARLETIDGWEWNPKQDRMEAMFGRCADWYAANDLSLIHI